MTIRYNTDIHDTLTKGLGLLRQTHTGQIWGAEIIGKDPSDGFLFRAMTFNEARNWYQPGWLPEVGPNPWATGQVYSEINYLKGDYTVQFEVEASNLLSMMTKLGATTKPESLRDHFSESWGAGPSSQIGRVAGDHNLKALSELYSLHKDLLPPADQNLGKNKFKQPGNQKRIQNELFAALFKQRFMATARVVRRVYVS